MKNWISKIKERRAIRLNEKRMKEIEVKESIK